MTSDNHKNSHEPAVAIAVPMTPDRWRAVDDILQHAIACQPNDRDAFVRQACLNDESLLSEVTALLAVHDATPSDFLERPAAQVLGLEGPSVDDLHRALLTAARGALPSSQPEVAEPVRGRRISAHVAVFAAMGGILAGVVLGWGFSSSSIVARWKARAPWSWGAAAPAPVVNADVDVNAAVANGLALVVVDRSGAPRQTIVANRPWTPRFSPDGRRVAYGAFGSGRSSSDLWITDLETGVTKRITDDDGDSNDPQWNPSGTALAFSVNAPEGKDVAELPLSAGGQHIVAVRPGIQFPNDWPRDGKVLLVTDEQEGTRHDILIQPTDGSSPRAYVATMADETAARMSPDGRWVAYTSDESGRAEVYIDSYPIPGRRVVVSRDGGIHPVWRGDGRELYYWRDGALVAAQILKTKDDAPAAIGTQSELFRAAYEGALNTMYDVSPDGQRFVIVERRRD